MSRQCGWLVAVLVGSLGMGLTAAAQAPSAQQPADEQSHWAFQVPQRTKPPEIKNRAWAQNPIDGFIAAGLEANGLQASPEAERTALLRRVTFDLIGLPPSADEIDRFTTDRSPDAFEKVVDRLLASPQYGVRAAQHWLDLARYADTDGFEFDQPRPNAWRYRDWVVDAFNRDMPYDRFIRLQLAGDEYAPDDPSAFIATGFNRCYPDMVDLNDQALRRQNALNDITETTGLVFLGLTIGCARCHDHKSDPITQADFYKLQAFFSAARFRDDYPLASTPRRREFEKSIAAWGAALAQIQASILRIEKPVRDKVAPGLPMGALDTAVAAFNKPEAERSTAEVMIIYDLLHRDGRIKDDRWPVLLDAASIAERARLINRLEQVRRAAPPAVPTARGIDEAGPVAPPTYLLKRGEFGAKGPIVEPAFPAVLASAPPVVVPGRDSTGRRTALAKWLTNRNHPLTARVIVNRLWQGHFAKGLVETPSDFGKMGSEPTHPELLDWLAAELIESGWSLKSLHRLIVTTATYRRSSKRVGAADPDPENHWLAHQNRRRLDGEAIRDAMLAASGQLNPALGGPPVFPPLPAELTKLSSKGATWPVSWASRDRNRRSLYIFVRRNLRYPFFEAFDRPDTNASCPRRAITTTAPQALSLLNSRLSGEAARALSIDVERSEGRDVDAKVERAYLLALGRRPDQAERELARAFLSNANASFAEFCLALFNLNEFVYVD